MQGVKLEGQGAGIEWNSILASAQSMVQRHQAEELKTGADTHLHGVPSHQHRQQEQGPVQSGQQPTAIAAAAAGGNSAGDSGAVGPSGSEQQQHAVGTQALPAVKQEEGPSQKPEEAWLSDMVSGCVSMLLTMQKCAQQPVPGHSVNAALVNCLKMLQPHAASNQPIFRKIEQTVMLLRNQLLQGSAN